MLVYVFYCIIDLLFNFIAYLTNPFVILFADEVGELPWIFTWWQTWDNTLDVEWMITEHHVPKFAEYDFNRHYRYYSEWDARALGKQKGFVILLDPNFTLKERFQRYICRLVWIYRNCAYGWSYYVTGRVIDGAEVIEKISSKKGRNNKCYFGVYKHWLINEPFCYFFEVPWNPKDISWLKWTNIDHKFVIKIFLGWKFQFIKSTERERAMLALFAWPFRHLDT